MGATSLVWQAFWKSITCASIEIYLDCISVIHFLSELSLGGELLLFWGFLFVFLFFVFYISSVTINLLLNCYLLITLCCIIAVVFRFFDHQQSIHVFMQFMK